MTRSSWKQPFFYKNLLYKITKAKKNNKIIKSWARNCEIMEGFNGATIELHNGIKFIKILINNEMIGHKLGEFVSTRKPCVFKKQNKKK
jgi:small subunit ribosomal protein S19